MGDERPQPNLYLPEAQIRAAVADCIAVLSSDGRILQINSEGGPQFERAPAISGEGGRTRFADLWHEEERSAIEDAIRAASAGSSSSAEGTWRSPDGARLRRFITRFYPIKLTAELGEILALTEELSTGNAAPSRVDTGVHRLIEVATEGLGQVDETGRWRFLNSAGAELLGFESPLMAGISRATHHSIAEFDAHCPLCQALKTGVPQQGAGSVSWRHDGGSISVSYAVMPSREGGATVRFSDDSERLGLERALRGGKAELSALERHHTAFIATLAHELRNPLAPMRTALDFLGRTGEGNAPPITQLREMMDRQVEHLVRLTNEFLELARLASGQVSLRRALIALQDILASALEASAPSMTDAGTLLTVELPPEPLMLHADSMGLTQAFTNLLSNAARFTPAGGQIQLRAEARGDSVLIEVADTGVGIAPESLDVIFSMFTPVGEDAKGRKTGLGIGLYRARRWVELHDGTLLARSAGVGYGTSFTMTLPLAKGSAEGRFEERPPTPAIKRALRVLIVDDNVDAAESLRLLLELGGQQIAVAHDGAEALRRAKEFRPDVILLDLGLPGMDGFEVARSLRAMPEIGHPILVAVTGWGSPEDRVKSREAGFDEHLTKPVEIATLELLLAALPPAPTNNEGGNPAVNGNAAKAGH
jgi:signal transduction histidine kinase/CheY-like chemotaxis protein